MKSGSNTEVLIESDWNLKYEARKAMLELLRVLIESDWNLKMIFERIENGGLSVLIESDWNLKLNVDIAHITKDSGINRIRLEFKVRI